MLDKLKAVTVNVRYDELFFNSIDTYRLAH